MAINELRVGPYVTSPFYYLLLKLPPVVVPSGQVLFTVAIFLADMSKRAFHISFNA